MTAVAQSWLVLTPTQCHPEARLRPKDLALDLAVGFAPVVGFVFGSPRCTGAALVESGLRVARGGGDAK